MPTRCRILCRDAVRRQATFHCTLGGPFDNLFFARLSPTRTLCGSIVTFIPASTVCLYEQIVAQKQSLVNSFFKKTGCKNSNGLYSHDALKFTFNSFLFLLQNSFADVRKQGKRRAPSCLLPNDRNCDIPKSFPHSFQIRTAFQHC